MKVKKNILSLFIILGFIFILTSCNNNDEKIDQIPGATTYIYEAEHVDLSELESASHSGQVGGSELAYGDGTEEDIAKGWSNGYYVGPTYKDGFKLKFVFNSSTNEEANFILRLGSELGNIRLNSTNFEVKLNNQVLNYGSINVSGKKDADSSNISFKDYQIGVNLSLLEGENILTVTIKENNLFNGSTGGPMIDCLKIITKSEITWEIIDNPTLKGQA